MQTISFIIKPCHAYLIIVTYMGEENGTGHKGRYHNDASIVAATVGKKAHLGSK